MKPKKKAVFNWSGGKDSALALYKILQSDEYEVVSLLTTLNEDTLTSSIHAIPLPLLEAQAKSIGIPLYTVALSKDTRTYEEGMGEAVRFFKHQGVKHFIFGDIFLEDVRQYREERLRPLGITLVEPLWGLGSHEVMRQFLASGIKTKVVVTQADKMDGSYIGRTIDADFVQSIPEGVDVCGENGEYHSFAYDGPFFQEKVDVSITQAKQVTYTFRMDDGKSQEFIYWQAEFGFKY